MRLDSKWILTPTRMCVSARWRIQVHRLLLLSCCIASCTSYRSIHSATQFEGSYLKIGPNGYPEDAQHDYNPNGTETQGITHDDDNWYLTITDYDGSNGRLWRIPVGIDLDQNLSTKPGVQSLSEQNIPDLYDHGYWHWGDPDHYKFQGYDYVIVPMTSDTDAPAIAVFQVGNPGTDLGMSYLGKAVFPMNGFGLTPSGWWVAIRPDSPDRPNEHGRLFTSWEDGTAAGNMRLLQYDIAWDQLQVFPPTVVLTAVPTATPITLHDQAGNSSEVHSMQGGEFSPTGELLYLSMGAGKCVLGDGIFSTDGIHVYDTSAWTEVQRSSNRKRGQTGYFDYVFDNGCTCSAGGFGTQTPEGLTVWDLDNGRAPNIRGQLHAIVNFYNRVALCPDTFSLQHFGVKLYVDPTHGFPGAWTDPRAGTQARPFNTVRDALNWYPSWDGARVILAPWAYHETGTFSTPGNRVLIDCPGGGCTLGGDGDIIGVQLFENPNYQGDSRFFTSNVPDLDLGTINFADVASSVRIYNLSSALLYDGANYTGAHLTVTQDIPDLTPLGWNDRVGSLKTVP